MKGLASEFEFKFKFMLTSNCWLNVKKLRKLGFAVEIGWLELGELKASMETEKCYTRDDRNVEEKRDAGDS